MPRLTQSLTPPTTKMERRYKISKTGWFGVVRVTQCHLETAPFDKACTSSY